MAPAAASKKRRRAAEEAEPAPQDASDDSTSASDSDSGSDSSDEETEHALFRPVAAEDANEDDDDDDDDGASDDECGDEDEEVSEADDAESASDKEADAEQESLSKKKQKKQKKSAAAEANDGANTELEEEVARKTEATVYVEGIPYRADEGDLVSHFAPCGIVKEVRMPRYQDSGKPRGYAHVVFESASAIAKALRLDGKYLFGRYLTVKQAERPRTLEQALQEQKSIKKVQKGCRTVFIKQLPYDVDEAAVKEALATCGTITSVRLPVWNHTKKLKGFGYVEFAQEKEAVAAVRRSGMKIGNRMVLISLETAGSMPKASFRLRDGQFWNKGEDAKQSLVKKLSATNDRRRHENASDKKDHAHSKKRKTAQG